MMSILDGIIDILPLKIIIGKFENISMNVISVQCALFIII